MLLQLAAESSIPEARMFYCPYPRCSSLMVTEEIGPDTSAECPACHRLLCLCRTPWHAGQSCGEAKVTAYLPAWHNSCACQSSVVTANSHSRLLPKCSVLTACSMLSACSHDESYAEVLFAITVHPSSLLAWPSFGVIASVTPSSASSH